MFGNSGNAPGLVTSPVTYTRRLLIVETLTVTWGLLMYFFNPSLITAANSIGVSPAACTSFRSGSVIFPSGLTGTNRVISGSFHTSI